MIIVKKSKGLGLRSRFDSVSSEMHIDFTTILKSYRLELVTFWPMDLSGGGGGGGGGSLRSPAAINVL